MRPSRDEDRIGALDHSGLHPCTISAYTMSHAFFEHFESDNDIMRRWDSPPVSQEATHFLPSSDLAGVQDMQVSRKRFERRTGFLQGV